MVLDILAVSGSEALTSLRLLDKLGGSTVNLPTSHKVIHNAQDKDKSEDGA